MGGMLAMKTLFKFARACRLYLNVANCNRLLYVDYNQVLRFVLYVGTLNSARDIQDSKDHTSSLYTTTAASRYSHFHSLKLVLILPEPCDEC